jgi:hypothetical protein
MSHPELLVDENGTVFLKDNMKKVSLVRDHGYSTRGYVLVYKYKGKHKNVSLLSVVFETQVKGSKITSSDFVEPKDGNEYNYHPSNLHSVGGRYSRRKPNRAGKTEDGYSTWMGIDEVYC